MNDPTPLMPLRAEDLPDLPTTHLPTPVANWVKAVAESIDVDVSMPCLMATTMLASIYQNAVDVEVAPGYKEPLCLYSAILANPGERKTSTMNAILGGLRKECKNMNVYWRTEQAVREHKIETAKEKVKEMLASGASPNDAMLQQAIQDLGMTKGLKQFILEDMTPAAFIQSLSISPTALIVSDEGEVWKKLGNGSGDDIGLWLRAHTAESYIKNRKTQEPVQIDRPTCSVILAMQPGIIRQSSSIQALSDQGLIARFLFAIAKSRIGRREIAIHSIDPAVRAAWDEWTTRIPALIKQHRNEPTTIGMSANATLLWCEWAAMIEYELRKEELPIREYKYLGKSYLANLSGGSAGRFRLIAGFGAKAAGLTARIAAITAADRIVTYRKNVPMEVTSDDMEKAISFVNAVFEHALAVRALMDGEDSDDQLAIIGYFNEVGWPAMIKRGRLIQTCKDLCSNRDAAEAAVAHLIERGYFHILNQNDLRCNNNLPVARATVVEPHSLSYGENENV